ncbi:MAG: GerA spore germination protein [Paenibacillus sp.]|jgi:spore germination protein KA|nr:GerA spore germination protein [Paenibacillus sp.]
MRWLRKWKRDKSEEHPKLKGLQIENEENSEFTSDIEQNEMFLKEIFQNCSDIEYRKIRKNDKVQRLIVYISSLIDKKILDDNVLMPMMVKCKSDDISSIPKIEDLENQMSSIGTTSITSTTTEIVRNILHGHAAILMADTDKAITVNLCLNPLEN